MGAHGLLLALAASSASSAFALRARAWTAGTWREEVGDLESYTFERFVKDFPRDYKEGSDEWAARSALFEKSLQEMIAHNAVPDQMYMMGVSKFMDWKDHEKTAILGYRGRKGSRTAAIPAGAAMLRQTRFEALPASFTAAGSRLQLGVIRDQGNCGSCWAEAASLVLEGQIEANSTLKRQLSQLRMKEPFKVPLQMQLSEQAMVACTDNPRHCGGKGGCEGATAELGYQMVMGTGGLPFASEWKYTSGMTGQTPACRPEVFANHRIGITGYEVLPSNKVHPLKAALVQSGGPIAVSVDASLWFSYAMGIFSDTTMGREGDFQVNHAVTLVAYQEPRNGLMGWWRITNSWGPFWGEAGHIRIEMKRDEEQHCGWDTHTHEGLACDGDPDKAWVCGTCGILYDSVYPTGLHLNTKRR